MFGLSFRGISQDIPLFDKVFEQTNLNLNKNYDTTVLVNHHFNELVFDETSILRHVYIDGISYEAGRVIFNRPLDGKNRNFKKNAYIYDLGKNIHYQNIREHTIAMSSRPQIANSYLQQKHGLYMGFYVKFTPPMPFLFSSEVLTNSETVTDTIVENKACYIVKRETLIEFVKNKDKKRPSDYRSYIRIYSIIDKNDFGTLYYQKDQFIANRDSSMKFKERYIDVYEKLGNHYYRKENYSIAPRYSSNHYFDYNNKDLYTIITRKTTPVIELSSVNDLEEISLASYTKICKKVDKVSDNGLKIYEKAKEFVNAPFPKFENLKKYWSE